MASKSVTHSTSLSVGDISLIFSNSQTADSDPTNFLIGDQRVTTTPRYVNGDLESGTQPTKIGDIEVTGHKVMLLLRNDNAAGAGDLDVSLVSGTHVYELAIKPQQMNLLTVEDLDDVVVRSSAGDCDYTYMAVQLDT